MWVKNYSSLGLLEINRCQEGSCTVRIIISNSDIEGIYLHRDRANWWISVLRNASSAVLLMTDFLEKKRHLIGQKLSYTRNPVAQFVQGSTTSPST